MKNIEPRSTRYCLRNPSSSSAAMAEPEWTSFLRAWWDELGSSPVSATTLRSLALDRGLLLAAMGPKDEKSQAIRLGKLLRTRLSCDHEEFTVKAFRDKHIDCNRWSLSPVTATPCRPFKARAVNRRNLAGRPGGAFFERFVDEHNMPQWIAFLRSWHRTFGTKPLRVLDLVALFLGADLLPTMPRVATVNVERTLSKLLWHASGWNFDAFTISREYPEGWSFLTYRVCCLARPVTSNPELR